MRGESVTAPAIPARRIAPRHNGRHGITLVNCEAVGSVGPDSRVLTPQSTHYATEAPRIPGWPEGALVRIAALGS